MARLVAIGDSLTQGFHSLAITNTDQSYPAMIAEAMGIRPPEFRLPDFRGKGGLPCSLEWLARRLEEKYGADLDAFEWIRSLHTIEDCLDEVEDYWERGPGTRATADVLYHNLAVWGFTVADSYQTTAATCRERTRNVKDNWWKPPSDPMLRTALNVLNPARVDSRWGDTQVSIAARIKATEGTIDHLIACLGINNCLLSVLTLDADAETGDDPPESTGGYTLWRPRAFEKEYVALADRISAIEARHVYVGTVPHVTIPPVTRGIMKSRGALPEGRKYFDYYTHFWIHDREFDEDRDPYLSGQDVEKIDRYIDEYNAVIRREAHERGWRVVELCQVLDQLAVRRNHGRPTYVLPQAISDLSIRFLELTAGGKLKQGGLIGLDGLHPTACGYALVAQLFIDEMRANEPAIRNIDFAAVRAADTLVSHAPRTLDDMLGALRTLERWFHISQWMQPVMLREARA